MEKEISGHRLAVMEALEQNKNNGLTSLEAFKFKPACTRLADVVFSLKKRGVEIVSTTEKAKTGGRFSRYYLAQYGPSGMR